MDAAARSRLQWKCRRGLLELDIVLQRYLEQRPEDHTLWELLDLPDNDLWDIIAGRTDDYDPKFEETVARLRAA
jgi:antitoxin CptB